MTVLRVIPLVIALHCCLVLVSSQVDIVFVDTYKEVVEGQQFDLRIKRLGPITKVINVIVELDSGNTNGDFYGDSQLAGFDPTSSDLTTSVTLTVAADGIPEIDETYYFTLKLLNSSSTDARIAFPNACTVKILANDNAYGLFNFIYDVPQPQRVVESPQETRVINIGIARQLGTFGNVTVSFQVQGMSAGATVGLNGDINPPAGDSIRFMPGDTQYTLQLQIRQDTIPENDEVFVLTLTAASHGARVTEDNYTIIITANDAPVRFSQSLYHVDEGSTSNNVVNIQVNRGLDVDGTTRIGDISRVSSVDYQLFGGTAILGQDFKEQNGLTRATLTFGVNETTAYIAIVIINDLISEQEESFKIVLSKPSIDVVISNPSEATVVINSNDDASGVLSIKTTDFNPPVVQVNEDNPTSIQFTVQRTRGSFNTVSVDWNIVHDDNVLVDVSLDLTPVAGTVTFAENEREKVISLSVVTDMVAEPAERFRVQLLENQTTGGVKVEGITYGIVIIEDSDNAYGVVQFDVDTKQKLLVDPANPRMLQLTISRVGNNMGDLHLNMSVMYTPTSGAGAADVLEKTFVSMVLFQGKNETVEHIHLLQSAVLQVGGEFTAVLTGVALVTAPDIGPFNSPKIGPRSIATIRVTTAEASGEIGFASVEPLVVQEPVGSPAEVRLTLSREGTSGEAVVSWLMMGTSGAVTAGDTGPTQGNVTMLSERSTTDIIITIQPDNIPELAEELTVLLTGVQPAMQRLKPGATSRKLIIAENDSPGGVFRFSNTTLDSYSLIEGESPITLSVVRDGGDLVERSLQYIIPGGEDEFYGATNILTFPPGLRSKTFSIAAKHDGIPELEETFTLRLQNYNNQTATIGSRSSITVKVMENDKPYGVLQFKETSLLTYLKEGKPGAPENVTITVERKQGLFGTIQVTWSVVPGDGVDLRPSTGFLTFTSNQGVEFIRLSSVPDELTEAAENFTVRLSDPKGGAELGSLTTATVVIPENDYPLRFLEPKPRVMEPSEVKITIRRDGPTNTSVTLRYKTVDGTAIAGSDYEAITAGEITFNKGELLREITLRVLDDSVDEGEETFFLQVYEIIGDAVFENSVNQAEITIEPNDLAYGTFKFISQFSSEVEEGSTASFLVAREGGKFGGVQVNYELFNIMTNRKAMDGEDFEKAENLFVRFEKNDITKTIYLKPLDDGQPEMATTYTVTLTSLEIFDGRNDSTLARIADDGKTVYLTIKPSDDPNGRFGFPQSSMDVKIAEDYYPGTSNTAQARLTVERRAGIFGPVEVLWEVYTDKVAAGLPRAFDLIFLGEIPAGLMILNNMRRPNTFTNVVAFTGLSQSYINVPEQYWPTKEDIADGFSVSAWIQPQENTNGYILAKTNPDGSRTFYSLKIMTSLVGTQLIVGYSATGSNENINQSVTYPRNIQDLQWHHVVVTIERGNIIFFMDGNQIGNQTMMTSQVVLDNGGHLTVGALYRHAGGIEQFKGYLQDVRLYSRKLSADEVKELYNTPARADVNPVNGILTYTQGQRLSEIALSSVQDAEEESDEVFTVKLISAKGGATISQTDMAATLTVLKSDNANGVFSFAQDCQPSRPTTEDTLISCMIDRQRGDDGRVLVTWVIYQIEATGTRTYAAADFTDYTGQVLFQAGERSKYFSVQLKEDQIPELEERFEIELVNATTDDNLSGTTNISGASVDLAKSKSVVIVGETDFPYGLLEFSKSSVPPQPNDPIIPPATERPVVRVAEESGLVRLLVVRAQGYQGDISVEWRTTDDTAKSSGKNPPDFTSAANRLTMRSGERYGYIDIVIVDNNIPEDEKQFFVTLLNPSGGAALGLGSTVTVIINPSDGAFGVFQFAQSSLGVQAVESGEAGQSVGYTTTPIQIERTGGSLGTVVVYWEVSGDIYNDIVDHSGTVTFANMMTTANLLLKIRIDTVPELDELFVVNLVNVSRGSLGDPQRLRSEVTVLANDDPYGVFVIPSTQRPLRVEESNRAVTLTIQRLYGTHGSVEVNYTTLSPTEMYPYIPTTVSRADTQDYKMSSGTILFVSNQTSAEFVIEILDDTLPEEDEAVYVRLTGIKLIVPAQIRPVDMSPRLGPVAETIGQVIIGYNDNANGEIVLSPENPQVLENQTEPFLFATRHGGMFGEVTVTFQVKDGSAIVNQDYVVNGNQVTLLKGVSSVPLPITIKDDSIPEPSETFTVTLVQVYGGGVLGTIKETNVIILVSDDPNGAFAFASSGMSQLEPENAPVTVEIFIERTGGTVGVVTLNWNAMLNGGLALDDITPSSGSVHFVSNEIRQSIKITVLPDNIPEGNENIQIHLLSASNGGRIKEPSTFTLTIPSNDNPHGVVQLTTSTYTVQEGATNSVQQIPLVRTGGNFGELRVYYSTEVLTAAVDPGNVANVFDYFSQPQQGSRGIMGERVNVPAGSDPTAVCATECLKRVTCLSFEVNNYNNARLCTMFTTVTNQALIVTTEILYYVKDTTKAGQFTGAAATPGEDYAVVTNGYVLIGEGVMAGSVPVTIMADTIPELDEKFLVRLTRVDVTGEPPSPENSPYLGNPREAVITILKNDDTYGAFRLYSDSPQATDNGHTVPVEETQNLAVVLIVERGGGSIGEVSVTWSVDGARSSAVYGTDYSADGATLTFAPGDTRRLITVTILDDTVPEDEKTVVVQLSNPVGGASISNGTATIVILPNDNVAGVLALDKTSVLANEGDTITLGVTRTPALHGTVSVDWVIQGVGGINPATGFQIYQGSLQFLPGEASKIITLNVLRDDVPEVNEEYQLNLINIKTTGIGITGAATINPIYRSASITIAGSNNPHGVVQFGPNSLSVRVNEDSGVIKIQIDRKFGAIGRIRVQYEITTGSVSVTNDELHLASAGSDFVSGSRSIDLDTGVTSAAIEIEILPDTLPEVDEVFIVRLLSVNLINSPPTNLPPVIGTSGITSQIIINANDGTKGVAVFAPDSASVQVDETSRNISLTVLRSQGTFGEVSLFFYAQSIVNGTNLGLDYKITPKELLFMNKEDRKEIVIEIVNDDIPEPDETFEVILSNPKNGLELGTPSRATVTILANDDAAGFVFFNSDDLVTLEEPSAGSTNASIANLVVMRGPGMYGAINVPFQVVPEKVGNSNDLTPMQGTIRFNDKETSATLTLTVLNDDQPEDIERFTVHLLQPDNTAKLGTRTERTVIILQNDSPNGLLSLYAAGTRLREISVEEGVGMIYFDLVRTQGLEGQVTVDIATEPHKPPGAAESVPDILSVDLVPVQILPTTDVRGWHSFSWNGSLYLLMLKPGRVGPLQTQPGTSGAAGVVDTGNLQFTTLFRWQGELLPIQTLETDSASSATSFVIDGTQYLFVTNMGNHNRYETVSRLYRVNLDGDLTVIQDLHSSGASSAVFYPTPSGINFLLVANSQDNTGNSQVTSDIWRWEPANKKFSRETSLSTLGARGLASFTISDKIYLAVANHYDSVAKSYQVDSKVYLLNANNQFSQHQSVPTVGAIDVEYVRIGSLDLLIFANNRDNTVSSPQQSDVYRWDIATQRFILHQRLETNRVEDVEVFQAYDNTYYVVFANSIGNSMMYAWGTQSYQFTLAWSGTPAYSLYPILVPQRAGNLNLMAVGDRNITANPVIHQVVKLKDSDFAPRTITMTLNPGQDLLHTSVVVLQDTKPEANETFSVVLKDPTGGVEIGPDNRITVNILSNDNAYGIIEIAPDSLDISRPELPGRDNTVPINVVRKEGYHGRVIVKWVATGDHDGTNDIMPLEGQVEFPEGQLVSTISLTIRDDDIAELQEVTYIQLTEVIESGTSLPGRGAIIGVEKTAKLTVLANDSPYGVVRWERTTYSAVEPDQSDANIILYIVREQGLAGDLQVTYRTSVDQSSPVDKQAVAGEDFIARDAMVIIQENVTRAPVEIVIKQDLVPEADEKFLVNITKVTLLGTTPVPGSEPSIRIPGNVAVVTISENDNARGIVQFNVTTNIEGRIDVYEQYGQNTTVVLPISRTVGLFGAVTVVWQADPGEATLMDYAPESGTVNFANTQQEAKIYVTILDDTVYEPMETFDVKLISVTGGAVLGPANTVKIAILKNDSPYGLFRFVTTTVVVRESTSPTDPNGEVQLIVERIQGSEGTVRVQWRLNAEATYDFYEPHSGELLFSQGQKQSSISLRTKPDEILEGEEHFKVSLITADNDANISPTQGDATIRVLADPGASGTVEILPDYRTVYIGEPGESKPNYDGKVQVVLTRGAGIYGDISVTWSVTPRDERAFLQVEGMVNMADLQQTATIILQALDDSIPELRTVYTLQINSATGGALVSKVTGAATANVVFVASDFPHGEFVFDMSQSVITTEDQYSVSVPVLRRFGLNGQVDVGYTTHPGTALPYQDYFPETGTLTFQHGQREQVIKVRPRQDDEPEGLETFYLNLTTANLVVPQNNDYSKQGDLQLDMAPAIGSVNVKEIMIEKNDNAEGTIEFLPEAMQFTVTEEAGVARLPLIRSGGNFGRVSVMYKTFSITATEGVDYLKPSGEVVFEDGVRNTTLDVTIQDDSELEYEETFRVQLTTPTGGALLGNVLTSVVTIAKSDYPNGRFGFKGTLDNLKITVTNNATQQPRMLTVERTGGLLGQQTVYWRIMGPNNPFLPLEATNDIAYVTATGDRTSGTLIWQDGQSGDRMFTLVVKPFSSWEIEKVFVIEIYRIEGFPQTVGHGEISPTHGKVILTVTKFGDPNGIVWFDSPAQTVREVEEPDGPGTLVLQFPVIRRLNTGTVGNITVFWEIEGPWEEVADVLPRNGSILIPAESRKGDIVVKILSDDVPELTETYNVKLTKIVGGAEIDSQYNVSTFRIRYNDAPHGLFGIQPENQTVVVDSAGRHVKLLFTRHAGTFGRCFLTYSIRYDLPQSDIVLNPSDGRHSVTFEEGESNKTVSISIGGTGFLELGTTFSVSLVEVQYLGAGVTEPPVFKAGETEVKVSVPEIAANSKVGFQATVANVNEELSTCTLTLSRQGLYGTLDVPWQSGFPEGRQPGGFVVGTIQPMSGSVTISQGIAEKNFTIQLSAKIGVAELFAIHLPAAPSTTVPGGARLDLDRTLVQIEPHGVLRFARNSTASVATELYGKVYLQVIRLYGSLSKVETQYRAVGVTADHPFDFVTIQNHAVVMEERQTSGLIMIEVVQDNKPEQEESFHVNLTSVEKFPTDTAPSISPRLSYLYDSSVVTIQESNDPYGILCLEPEMVVVPEIHQDVNLTVKRTGGIFGTVRVTVRTVGGGESWGSSIVPKPGSDSNNTIADILGNRDRWTSATGGSDYVVMNTEVEFKQGETEKTVALVILGDSVAEPEETVLVYLTQPTGGARVAAGEPDGGKKGYAVVTILPNDLSNGKIGFSEDSKLVTVNEDLTPIFNLKLVRTEAYFGEVQVSWEAKLRETSDKTADVVLTQQLVKTAGTTICPGRQEFCPLEIGLINDQIPEEEHEFYIKLIGVKNDAELNEKSLFAKVRVEASDYIRGLIEYTKDSSVLIVSHLDEIARLKVNRVGGQTYRVEVGYRTMQMQSQRTMNGVTVYVALEGEDYKAQTGSLVFEPDRQELQYIDINLTPFTASANSYPKQFYVDLKSPTNGASINPAQSQAVIIIVKDRDVGIWKIVTSKGDKPLNNEEIINTLTQLDGLIQVSDDLSEDEVKLVEVLISDIVDEGLKRKLPVPIINQLLNVLCKMMTPDKNDATRGRYTLAELMEKLAYLLLTETTCSTPEPPEMLSLQCRYARVSAGRWPLGRLLGLSYSAQRQDEFKVPTKIPDPPSPLNGSECLDFHMIEYDSEQWFQKTTEKQLLSNKVMAFGLKDRASSYTEFPVKFKIHSPDRRIATKKAQCVYYDIGLRDWVGPREITTVTNDLDLGVDDFVECSVKHLTHYAVKAVTMDPGLVGYSIWFFISCFICIGGLLLAILAHHVCSISAMFSASLLMHMCFAALATQICYVVAAYLSPDEILVYTLNENNYRCIVMGLFLHYFFLAQFTWMMTQSINFWKILVLNDEHTDRKYVLFFLTGWGLPVILLAIFYVVVYNMYKYVYNMPVNFIYGDVNNNGDMCFITNPYAALGGVIVPVLLLLLVVAIVFVKAFQVTPQWQAYDDIYRGRYNIKEVRTLLLFWAVIIITWLWGGLHLVYGQLWMLIIFCIFNILQGIMALVLYALLRNPCLIQCFAPQKASSYAVSAGIYDPTQHTSPGEGQYQFHPTTLDVGSLKGSRASLLNESWERDSAPGTRSTMKVRRTLPYSGNIYVEPPVLHQGTISESKDFDDLLYALKTGGSFTPSDGDSLDSDKLSDISSKVDKYELRRIDIADTHL